MKKILVILFVLMSVVTYSQNRVGVYDKSVHATEKLEVDADTMVSSDTTVHLMDLAYFEWSSDGVSFEKSYELGDTWFRYSGFNKTKWDTGRVALNLWTVSGDSVILVDDKIVYNDTLIGDFVQSSLYFLGADTLSTTNIYNGGAIDGYMLIASGDTNIYVPQPSGVGGAYGRNVGTSGIGVYSDTIGSELQFKNIAEGLGINISEADSTITIAWDGSTRGIIAGVGLSGGGDLNSDVTINMYIPELLELTSLSALSKSNDFLVIYDESAGQHKKINPVYLHPDVYINDVRDAEAPSNINFIAGDNVSLLGDTNGGVQITATNPDLYVDSTLSSGNIDRLNLVAGSGVNLTYLGNGSVLVESTAGGLPICDEGQFLAYVGGEWTCVNVCDYICADTIINIINNYNDTASVISPSGDVVINFSRTDCTDSVQLVPTNFVSSTLNLTGIIIPAIPSTGSLTYGGVAVTNGDTLQVSLGSFVSDVYYVSDDATGSQYIDNFTFQSIYSSNTSPAGTFTVSVSVGACVTDAVCFGYLYNWYAVDDSRELTSSADWSVPSYSDWQDLASYAGGVSVAGKLKKTGTAFWDSPNVGAEGLFGLDIVGGGYRTSTGLFNAGEGGTGVLWTSTTFISTTKRAVSFLHGSLPMQTPTENIKSGLEIRLVKDATGIPDGTTTTYTGNDGKTYNAVAINGLYWTTENLEETQYRNGDYIQGYDGGVYTPISNATWSGLTTGALCLYGDNINYQCK